MKQFDAKIYFSVSVLTLLLLVLSGSRSIVTAITRFVPADVEMLLSDPRCFILQGVEAGRIEIKWDISQGIEKFEVVIDDSPSFRQPITTQHAEKPAIYINFLEAGLVPGVVYYVLIKPTDIRVSFRLRNKTWEDILPNARYLAEAWKVAGRQSLQKQSGVRWNDKIGRWQIVPNWPPDKNVGARAYYIEYAARSGVNLALAQHNTSLIEELANFYLVYLERFTTVGELREGRKKVPRRTQSDDTVRTLPWRPTRNPESAWSECHLCNSQFFHPLARLVRVISQLPDSEKTSAMRRLTGDYTPLIVRDHLLRLVYRTNMYPHWGSTGLPAELINVWKTILKASSPPQRAFLHAMRDRDLWLVATAAEILGAHSNDPQMVLLRPGELVQLREMIRVGVQLFQKKRTLYHDTRNFQGKIVGSASYFNGDFADHRDMAYVGYESKLFPEPEQKHPIKDISWDISHFYRVPVFLRSLYDNRKATGVDFPQVRDIELVINQYVYKVFHGDLKRPLFRNFFDGHDGWYRVGYGDSNAAYPPSKYCDERHGKRPCLTVAGIYGWGLLAFLHEDLAKLQHALIKLAFSTDVEAVRFRERYYRSFSTTNAQGKLRYPFTLFSILAGVAERF